LRIVFDARSQLRGSGWRPVGAASATKQPREQEQRMHGFARTSPTALERTRPNRSAAAGSSPLLCRPWVQAAATAIVDFARQRPALTVAVLAATMLATSLTVRIGVTMLSQRIWPGQQPSASVEVEPETAPSTAPPVPPSPPEPEPRDELEPPAVATLPPIPAEDPTPSELPASVRPPIPLRLPRQIAEAPNLPSVHLPPLQKSGAIRIPKAPGESSPVVVAFKPGEESSAPVRTALAETMTPPGSGENTENSDGIMPVGCAGCGMGGGLISPSIGPVEGLPIGGGCSSCGGSTCVPGKTPCYPCSYKTTFGRFLCGVYECVCCPDPCYEPRWIPVTDSSFFTPAPRPITQQRFRWDSGMNLILPDRATYFWSPPPLGPALIGSPYRANVNLNYNDLSVYTEIATNLISLFVEMPYRSMNSEEFGHVAGFGDINMGTKSLLYDCELFQVSLQMKTYILSGNFSKGLGTGHVSLEPSILFGLRISPDTYLQTQIGEWIPFTTFYGGSVLLANASLNQVLWRVLPNVPLIGSWEVQTLSFQDGAYTDPYLGPFQKASGYTYINAGPGLRLFVCDRMDFGVGSSFALTEKHFAQTLFRSEFRIRY
jgi:hypothetical protein